MKDLSQCVSPLSWLFIGSLALLQLYFLLHPTWWELGVLFAVDILSFLVVVATDSRIFTRFYPMTELYLKDIKYDRIAGLDEAQKLRLFTSFMEFPRQRAIFTVAVSYMKVLPAAAVATFYWQHDLSPLMQLMIFFGTTSVNFAYFYGAVYVESHLYISDLIRELHEKQDWSGVFRNVDVTKTQSDFKINEWIALTAITVFMLILQWSIIQSHTGPTSELAPKVLLAGAAAFLLLGHLSLLSQKFIFDGIANLVRVMNSLNYRKTAMILPLHSYEALARFEKSFNMLLDRLRDSEKEIAAWVFMQAEKTRFRTLGEMSALIAHDMTGPLHVIKFCIEQIKVDPEKARDARYMNQLGDNLTRILELIEALRARLKNTNEHRRETQFLEAHQYVNRLLETQYSTKEFSRIIIDVDPALHALTVPMTRVDLIHVLDNLYRNCIESMLKTEAGGAKLLVCAGPPRPGIVSFEISDTGTGLGSAEFEQLTTFEFMKSKQVAGLGLKLTRRLIELNGGTLTVWEQPRAGFRTTFEVICPLQPVERAIEAVL